MWVAHIAWFLFTVIEYIVCQNSSSSVSRSRFLQTVLQGYDSRIPPSLSDGHSTVVTCELYINSVDSISETTMDYSLTIFLRQTWRDSRLAYGHLSNVTSVTMDARLVESIWVPDLFFPNEKKAHFHEVTVPNRLLRISRDGTVLYSARVSLTLSCAMRLNKFPLDNQNCQVQIESYAYTMEQLELRWATDKKPVEISDSLELPQFSLQTTKVSYCTKTYSTGSFPCLRVNIYLHRDIGYYMIQTYVPSALIVILSWVSFWISIDAVPARISLGVLTILTMTTQSSGSRASLPRVSYIKAIDIWMSTCLFFVFAALLEFAIINVLSRKEIKRGVKARQIKSEKERVGESKNAIPDAQFIRDPSGKHRARQVDKVSRTAFPVTFITFNVVYWSTYTLWENAAN